MRPLGTSDPVAVAQFRTIALLGRGRAGRVLLGVGPDGRLVALRLLPPQLVRDEGFRRELSNARLVVGPCSAPLVDGDLESPVPWVATAFVAGPSLRQAGRLPAESALVLAAGMAQALAEIHGAGLLHRNLNPANVLLAEDGPKVIDFGLTHAPGLAGSAGFLAPEQAAGQPFSWAGDVFAYGTILYTAVTGRNPFAAPSPQQTLANALHVEPDLGPVPDTLRWIIGPCLAKDPSRRPQPAQILEAIGRPVHPWPPAVQDMIARRRAEVSRTVSEPPEPGSPPPTVETPEARRKTAIFVGAGVVFTVFITALAAVLLVYGGGSHTEAAQVPSTTRPPVTTTATTTTTTATTSATTLAAAATKIDAGVWYTISNTSTGKCVDAAGGGKDNGTPVVEWTCGEGKTNQEWQFVPTANGFYEIMNRNAPALGLDVTGGPAATANGTPVQLWTYGGGANQQWKPVDQGSGAFAFMAQHSNACLDVTNGATDDGTRMQQWQCGAGANQVYALTPVQS
ncbi:serine/threonine protein kinase [Kutzneria sp. CA-103260]|uniref:serine/threonine protein kinase n=1 Tax=Kutzneria sp. CA-103260 TaxID=2802641 RepID=UPI001BA8FD73|nr:RICIN domain-containing protein [Kutzneria sp. CA-103260]QUQ63604.1 Serine/threonine-protein kinase PknD [Kutzneria sp. CA-103260]